MSSVARRNLAAAAADLEAAATELIEAIGDTSTLVSALRAYGTGPLVAGREAVDSALEALVDGRDVIDGLITAWGGLADAYDLVASDWTESRDDEEGVEPPEEP